VGDLIAVGGFPVRLPVSVILDPKYFSPFVDTTHVYFASFLPIGRLAAKRTHLLSIGLPEMKKPKDLSLPCGGSSRFHNRKNLSATLIKKKLHMTAGTSSTISENFMIQRSKNKSRAFVQLIGKG